MLGNSGYPYDAVERKWIAQYASLHDLILMFGHSNQCRQAGGGYIVSDCAKLQWELTIARGVSDFDIEHRQFGNKYIVQYREFSIEVSCLIDLQRKMRYNGIEVITMEKTMTLNLRVNPTVKQQAEDVLKQLGIPMATAIDMYLRQITLTGGIPFSLSLPKAPVALNADTMTDDQLHAALQVGIKEIQKCRSVPSVQLLKLQPHLHRVPMVQPLADIRSAVQPLMQK